MPSSLARGCFRTGKLERSPARCPRKTSLWRSGKGSVWQVRQLMIFRFWYCFYFLSAIHVFLVYALQLPLAHFLTRCLQCRQRAYSARSDIMVGTVPSICTVVAAGEFLWLIVSWLALLFLAGNSVIVWLFAVVYIFFCLYYLYFIIGALSTYCHCNFFCVFCLLLLLLFFFFFFFFASMSLLVHCFVAFIVCLLCCWQVSGRFLCYFALFFYDHK